MRRPLTRGYWSRASGVRDSDRLVPRRAGLGHLSGLGILSGRGGRLGQLCGLLEARRFRPSPAGGHLDDPLEDCCRSGSMRQEVRGRERHGWIDRQPGSADQEHDPPCKVDKLTNQFHHLIGQTGGSLNDLGKLVQLPDEFRLSWPAHGYTSLQRIFNPLEGRSRPHLYRHPPLPSNHSELRSALPATTCNEPSLETSNTNKLSYGKGASAGALRQTPSGTLVAPLRRPERTVGLPCDQPSRIPR